MRVGEPDVDVWGLSLFHLFEGFLLSLKMLRVVCVNEAGREFDNVSHYHALSYFAG